MQDPIQSENKEIYDYIFKIVIIGNGSCGKSSLLHYYINGKGIDGAKKNMTQTVGVEFASKLITLKGKRIKLQLWDTAGQERFRSVARTYYRGALGAIVVFDLTSLETFQAVAQWVKDARDFARADISLVSCGNKSDLADQRRIQSSQAQRGLQDYGIQYYETSALSGENIDQAFNGLANMLLERIENGLIDKDDLKPRLLSAASSSQKFSRLSKEPENEEKKQQSCAC